MRIRSNLFSHTQLTTHVYFRSSPACASVFLYGGYSGGTVLSVPCVLRITEAPPPTAAASRAERQPKVCVLGETQTVDGEQMADTNTDVSLASTTRASAPRLMVLWEPMEASGADPFGRIGAFNAFHRSEGNFLVKGGMNNDGTRWDASMCYMCEGLCVKYI